MNVLSLFSGIGGLDLGLERAGMTITAMCEADEKCRSVLRKHWPNVQIFHDIRNLRGCDLDATPDLICGGYPCQPFSQAGLRQGANDDRYLWPEMFRVIDETRPTWVVGENVVGHVNLGLDQVLYDLEGLGYGATAFVIPACAVDAPHRRDRVWIVANSASWDDRICDAPEDERQEPKLRASNLGEWKLWPREPGVGRVAHGVSRRVDRLKQLGNAVVPQVGEQIGRAIMAAHYYANN
jgi:DNA (cytosine-5)-methyltransferase 1